MTQSNLGQWAKKLTIEPKVNDPKPIVILDQAPSQPYRYLAILDFEATCDEDRKFGPSEIIEFPIVLVDTQSLKIVKIFHAYIIPTINPILTPFCTQLTGITQEMVSSKAGAKSFDEVWTQVLQFLKDNQLTASDQVPYDQNPFCFVTCGDWDLKTMLPTQFNGLGWDKTKIPAPFRKWINIKALFNSFYKTNKKTSIRGMTDMLTRLGLPLEGRHHSGIDDSRNISAIAIKMLKDGCVFRANNPQSKAQS